jgi:hypothetical protein
MVIGGMGGRIFFGEAGWRLDQNQYGIAGFVLGWLCYSIASNMLTYMHTAPEDLECGDSTPASWACFVGRLRRSVRRDRPD